MPRGAAQGRLARIGPIALDDEEMPTE